MVNGLFLTPSGEGNEDQSGFIEAKLYRGYFGLPNIWLAETDKAEPGDEYKFAARSDEG